MTTQRRKITELPELIAVQEDDTVLVNDTSADSDEQSKEAQVGNLFPIASTVRKGLMSTADRVKLDSIESGAQVNIQIDYNDLLNKPTIVTYTEATSTAAGLMSSADFTKLAGIESGAQVNVPITWSAVTNKPTIVSSLSDLFTFTNQAGKIIRVNAGEDGFDFIDLVLRANTDATITGDGTSSSPLSVANPFTSAEKTKLAGIEASATEDQTGAEMKTALEGLSGDNRLDASAIKNLPTVSQGTFTGIVQIVSNETLAGTGTSSSPLRVINPFTTTDRTKLDGIETGATRDLTDLEVVSLLEGLSGDARLDASAVRNLPTGGGITSVATDTTITGDGTSSNPLVVAVPYSNTEKNKLATIEENAKDDQTASEIKSLYESNSNTNPFTDTEQSKLSAIEDNATSDQTASEIVALIEGLSGASRLDASSIKNLPVIPGDATTSLSGLMSSADKTKLDGIETGATGDQTDSEIKAAYERNTDTNAFTDAYKNLVDNTPIFTIESINPSVLGSKLISDIEGDYVIVARLNNTEVIRRVTSTPTLEVIVAGVEVFNNNVTIPSSEDFSITFTIDNTDATSIAAAILNVDVLEIEFEFTGGSSSFEIVHKIPINGNVASGGSGGISTVATDTTISGNGSSSSPLSVTIPFTLANRTKLSGIESGATADQSATEIRDALQTLTGNSRLDASFIKNLPSTTATGGLLFVTSDATLSGLGTSASPLAVANPFTATDRNKLNSIETGATADQTAVEVRDLLSGLAGTARLPATAIRDLPQGFSGNYNDLSNRPTLFSGNYSDLSGRPTLFSGSYNDLTNKPTIPTIPGVATTSANGLMSSADKSKLNGIEANAKDDQTGAEIVTLLGALSGNARLPASAVRDIPQYEFPGVSTDSTLTGNGLSASTLKVANPFTAADETKLDGIEANATADQTASEIVALIESLTGNNRLNAGSLRNVPVIPGVATTSVSGLMSSADKTKLDGIEASADVNPTGTEIRDLLAGLSGNTRLDASAIKGLPGVATTSVNGLMSSGDKSKLDGIEANATADQTASEVRDLLVTLTGTNRLPASAVKDITTTFTNLTDTPSSYTGQKRRILEVSEDETGIIFAELSSVVNSLGRVDINTHNAIHTTIPVPTTVDKVFLQFDHNEIGNTHILDASNIRALDITANNATDLVDFIRVATLEDTVLRIGRNASGNFVFQFPSTFEAAIITLSAFPSSSSITDIAFTNDAIYIVYVESSGGNNARITNYSLDGTIGTHSLRVDSSSQSANGLGISSFGNNVYVQLSDGRVRVYEIDNTQAVGLRAISTITGIQGRGLYVTSDGLYSINGSSVIHYSNAGVQQFSFTLHTDNNTPHALVVTSSRIYVLDRSDDKVYVYTHTGSRQSGEEFNLHISNSSPIGFDLYNNALRVLDQNRSIYGYDNQVLLGTAELFDLSGIKGERGPAGGAISTDGSLSGLGTQDSPLMIVSPFTQLEKTKLGTIEENAKDDQTGPEIVTLLEALTGDNRLNASAIRNLPTGGGSSGLTAVNTDTSLMGDGTSTSPLRVTSVFTAAEKTKLSNIETGATADQTGTEIVALLSALPANSRLPVTAIRNLGIASTSANGLMSSADKTKLNGIESNAQRNVGVEYTQIEKTKLAGIESNAKDDQTGAEIVTLLSGLSGNSRLPASAVRDLPSGGSSFTIHSNTGVPASNIGNDGDWYLRTTNGAWYQKFAVTGWVREYELSGATVKSLLEALSGDSRLDASAIKNLPSGGGSSGGGGDTRTLVATVSYSFESRNSAPTATITRTTEGQTHGFSVSGQELRYNSASIPANVIGFVVEQRQKNSGGNDSIFEKQFIPLNELFISNTSGHYSLGRPLSQGVGGHSDFSYRIGGSTYQQGVEINVESNLDRHEDREGYSSSNLRIYPTGTYSTPSSFAQLNTLLAPNTNIYMIATGGGSSGGGGISDFPRRTEALFTQSMTRPSKPVLTKNESNVLTVPSGWVNDDPSSPTMDVYMTLVNVILDGNAEGVSATEIEEPILIREHRTPVTHTGNFYAARSESDSTPTAIPTDNNQYSIAQGQTVIAPASTNASYILLIQPSATSDITSINIGGVEQFGAFTKSSSTFTVSSVVYEYWISNRLLKNTSKTMVIRRD